MACNLPVSQHIMCSVSAQQPTVCMTDITPVTCRNAASVLAQVCRAASVTLQRAFWLSIAAAVVPVELWCPRSTRLSAALRAGRCKVCRSVLLYQQQSSKLCYWPVD